MINFVVFDSEMHEGDGLVREKQDKQVHLFDLEEELEDPSSIVESGNDEGISHSCGQSSSIMCNSSPMLAEKVSGKVLNCH